MSIPPEAIPYIIQGIQGTIQGGSRLLQPKFQNTKYGNYLKGVKKRGNYTQGQESTILNRVGSQASNQAQVSTNQAYGRMINAGMGNSIANNRMIRDADLGVRRQITDAGKEIDISEANAQQSAKMQYAQAMDKDKSERRNAMIGMVTGGLAGGSDYASAQNPMPTGVNRVLSDFGKHNDPTQLYAQLLESGISPEEAQRIMMMYEKQMMNKPNIDIMSPQLRPTNTIG
jgi:hypothetical protein